jgi:hypothetical protein
MVLEVSDVGGVGDPVVAPMPVAGEPPVGGTERTGSTLGDVAGAPGSGPGPGRSERTPWMPCVAALTTAWVSVPTADASGPVAPVTV